MKRLILAALAAPLILTGCDSTDLDSETQRAAVALNIAPVQAASKGNSAVALTRVRVLLRTIQFHKRDDLDSLDFRTEPLVAELSLDGRPTALAVADVDPGTYHKISFRVHKPEDGETPPDPDFRTGDSGNERYSVIVEGTFDGQPFEYRSSKAFHQKVSLDPDLEIDGTEIDPVDLTLEVDLTTWFTDNQGNPIDPRDATQSDRSRIDKSIRESFRARPRS